MTNIDGTAFNRRDLVRRGVLGGAAGLLALTPSRRFEAGAVVLPTPAEPAARLVIEVVDHRKVPPEVRVAVGTTVAWTNRGAEWLRVAALDGSFDSGRIEPGITFAHRFARPGAYLYVCENHAIAGTTGRINTS